MVEAVVVPVVVEAAVVHGASSKVVMNAFVVFINLF